MNCGNGRAHEYIMASCLLLALYILYILWVNVNSATGPPPPALICAVLSPDPQYEVGGRD